MSFDPIGRKNLKQKNISENEIQYLKEMQKLQTDMIIDVIINTIRKENIKNLSNNK